MLITTDLPPQHPEMEPAQPAAHSPVVPTTGAMPTAAAVASPEDDIAGKRPSTHVDVSDFWAHCAGVSRDRITSIKANTPTKSWSHPTGSPSISIKVGHLVLHLRTCLDSM